jgi:hypothetical protein
LVALNLLYFLRLTRSSQILACYRTILVSIATQKFLILFELSIANKAIGLAEFSKYQTSKDKLVFVFKLQFR